MVGSVNVNMDSTGIVGNRAGPTQSTDNILKVFHVIILEDRGHNLAGIIAATKYHAVAGLPLSADAPVGHGLPDAALAVSSRIGVVVGASKPGGSTEVGGNDLGCALTGDPGQFNFHTEVLLLHHVVHCMSLLYFVGWFVLMGT